MRYPGIVGFFFGSIDSCIRRPSDAFSGNGGFLLRQHRLLSPPPPLLFHAHAIASPPLALDLRRFFDRDRNFSRHSFQELTLLFRKSIYIRMRNIEYADHPVI